MNIRRLTIAEVQYIAYRLAKEFMEWGEPIPAFESRFPNILESCIAVPFQRFSNQTFYRGLVNKAAILFYLMIKNHPFENANKRIAVATLFCFLRKNGKWISISDKDLYEFAKSVAASDSRKKDETIRSRNCLKSTSYQLNRQERRAA